VWWSWLVIIQPGTFGYEDPISSPAEGIARDDGRGFGRGGGFMHGDQSRARANEIDGSRARGFQGSTEKRPGSFQRGRPDVFSKTSTIGKTASVTMEDALGSTSVNIPYGRSVTVSTPPTSTKISSGNMKAGTFNGGGAQTARKGKGSSGAGSSTVTDIVGWYVEAVTDNPNRPVKTYESPTGIVRQYETLQLQNGNN
jgi:hypothetical protein